jgi:hypothetical protein
MKICRKCLIEKYENEFHKDSQNKDGFKNTCKSCCKSQDRKLYEKNSLIILEKQKVYRKKNRSKYTKNEKIKSQTDPIFRMKKNLRKRVREYFKIIGSVKNNDTFLMIGKTPEDLRNYLESLFIEGRCWDNYGEWHIDHIIPLVTAKNESDLIKLIHYSNLQPLWAEDNLKKGTKII